MKLPRMNARASAKSPHQPIAKATPGRGMTKISTSCPVRLQPPQQHATPSIRHPTIAASAALQARMRYVAAISVAVLPPIQPAPAPCEQPGRSS
jgi:hypothetical protein